MLRDTDWGALDVLLVDMPRISGDSQSTMLKSMPLTGAIVVSTPQDIALRDARELADRFRAANIAVHGLILNMSCFVCDACGKRHHIFGGGVEAQTSGLIGMPILGEISLDPAIRECSDAGMPIVVSSPDGLQAGAYRAIARAVASVFQFKASSPGQHSPRE